MCMKNITMSLDPELEEKGRRYATRHRLSFNSLVRKLVEDAVRREEKQWLEEAFSLMDSIKLTAPGRSWKREDLYRG